MNAQKILAVHNYYQQPGGEDAVFAAEVELLRRYGHEVAEYIDDNRRISEMNILMSAVNTIWSCSSRQRLLQILKNTNFDVVHFHNTFLLISPSSYYACREAGVPVIQSLHNPRLLCPAATFYRNGHVCEECIGRTLPWPGVLHRCYRDSYAQTALVATMLTFHRLLKTWEEHVDAYVVFTDFYRRKFVESGIPAEKIVVKPHFVHPDPGLLENKLGDYAVFIGRLEPAKGVCTLLWAWQQLKDIPLKIRGDGLLLNYVRDFVKKGHLELIEVIERLNKEQLYGLLKGARFLVWPSEGYYETFGLVAIEAFACGIPVITSCLGVMAEIVEDGRIGLHFEAGNAEDLAAKVEWAWIHEEEMEEMGRKARREYEEKYTAERNYEMLIEIYHKVMSKKN